MCTSLYKVTIIDNDSCICFYNHAHVSLIDEDAVREGRHTLYDVHMHTCIYIYIYIYTHTHI